MRAIRVHQPGPPEALRYEHVPDPTPGPSQVVVRNEAIGVNFIDIYHRAGRYPLETPFTPGLEAAGVVVAVGAEVDSLRVGDRVGHGTESDSYAELQAVAADRLIALPEAIDTRQAAAALLQGMTAHYLVTSTFSLGADHSALIHAGAGGVGRLLIQMAKRLGARVITTVGSDAKADVARAAGADETIVYTQSNFAREVSRLTSGKGVNVVYDGVGRATFDDSLDCLRPLGMMALFGAASGPVPAFDPQILNQKGSIFLTRPSLVPYVEASADLQWRAGEVLGWVADGSLALEIHRAYSLADAPDAHRALAGRETTGKLLLIP